MKNRKVEGEKNGDYRQDKKGFIVNSRQNPLGNQDQDDNNEKRLFVKPKQRPAKKHGQADKNRSQDQEYFFGVKIKWPKVHKIIF